MLAVSETDADMADQTPSPRFEIIGLQTPGDGSKRRRPFGAIFSIVQTIVEDAYALAAKAVLRRQEKLEDRVAERRFAKHARSSRKLTRSNRA